MQEIRSRSPRVTGVWCVAFLLLSGAAAAQKFVDAKSNRLPSPSPTQYPHHIWSGAGVPHPAHDR